MRRTHHNSNSPILFYLEDRKHTGVGSHLQDHGSAPWYSANSAAWMHRCSGRTLAWGTVRPRSGFQSKLNCQYEFWRSGFDLWRFSMFSTGSVNHVYRPAPLSSILCPIKGESSISGNLRYLMWSENISHSTCCRSIANAGVGGRKRICQEAEFTTMFSVVAAT